MSHIYAYIYKYVIISIFYIWFAYVFFLYRATYFKLFILNIYVYVNIVYAWRLKNIKPKIKKNNNTAAKGDRARVTYYNIINFFIFFFFLNLYIYDPIIYIKLLKDLQETEIHCVYNIILIIIYTNISYLYTNNILNTYTITHTKIKKKY